MQDLPSISPRTRRAILDRFRISYLRLVLLFSAPIILAIAWHWHRPRYGNNGFPYTYSIPILIFASILINAISFYFQGNYLRSLLQRTDIASEFRVISFTFRFYFYNLAAAIGLSIASFYPLLITLFFFWIYPVIFWLVPYHLAIGFLLGRGILEDLNRQIQ
ncbi:hypothetical protein V0288_12695 [Pannus brasiliensis CCIBt3594]|uniref:Uncharacterized protein n=1 Tax=Pannus brasiliensis CCIBt3594 TaxID=1427578 RepID=A0AAW9QY21_9CHRO